MSKIDDYYFGPDEPHFLNKKGYEEYTADYLKVREALSAVKPLDNTWVPTEWLAQYPGATSMNDVSVLINGVWGSSYSSLREWQEAHGLKYRFYIATLDYSATGEGQTFQVIVRQAYSLGEFIYGLEKDVDIYFLSGMRFYDFIPERDSAFEFLVSHPLRELIEENSGHLNINLRSYVNYS